MYALIIVGGAIGEWNYYLLGSAFEILLLAGVGYYAWTWPRHSTGLSAHGTSDRRVAAGS